MSRKEETRHNKQNSFTDKIADTNVSAKGIVSTAVEQTKNSNASSATNTAPIKKPVIPVLGDVALVSDKTMVVSDKTAFVAKTISASIRTKATAVNKAASASTSNKTELVNRKTVAPLSNKTVFVNRETTVIVGRNEIAKTAGRPVLTMGSTNVINDRFELLDILGSGGMGVVFKARDRRKVEAKDSDPYVAIKLLNDAFKSHPDSIIALQREARRSQSLAHPNIVNVYDFDRDNDQVFMTMEYLQGKPLDQILKEGGNKPLKVSTAMRILKDVCAGMIHAHKNQVAHSDFKPGNIFVTKNGKAKVLDFGIARAVTGISGDGGKNENTLFDASSLGALTPAYASLEMLAGKLPINSDDVYAVGCVAYELFTGRHPYDKKNAISARKARMKPERIRALSARQWKALRKALAFRRKNRYTSASEFWEDFDRRISPVWYASAAVVAVVVAAMYWYSQQLVDFDEAEVTQNIEYEVKKNISSNELDSLLNSAQLTEQWEKKLQQEFDRYAQLVPETDASLLQYRKNISELYLKEAIRLEKNVKYEAALDNIHGAFYWGASKSSALALQRGIEQAILERDKKLALALAKSERQQHLARERKIEQMDRERLRAEQQAKLLLKQQAEAKYQTALLAVERALNCRAGFNFTELRRRLRELKKVSEWRYKKKLNQFGAAVADCVQKIANVNPAAGEQLKTVAIGMFPKMALINSIVIDPCVSIWPGTGRKSSNNCFDYLAAGGRGPKMVVVPALTNRDVYAISKYEISAKEIDTYCRATGLANSDCAAVSASDQLLPAAGLSIVTINGYAGWLTKLTGFEYRLPTYAEWLHAAIAKGGGEDPNRNCTVNSMGIRKGDNLLSVTTGRTNEWGLVNTVGNVQEIVVDGGALFVAGGRHTDRIENCLLTTKKVLAGSPDKTTGFRLVRVTARQLLSQRDK